MDIRTNQAETVCILLRFWPIMSRRFYFLNYRGPCTLNDSNKCWRWFFQRLTFLSRELIFRQFLYQNSHLFKNKNYSEDIIAVCKV